MVIQSKNYSHRVILKSFGLIYWFYRGYIKSLFNDLFSSLICLCSLFWNFVSNEDSQQEITLRDFGQGRSLPSLISILLFLTFILLGAQEAKAISNWQCKSQDGENREWYGQSDYQLSAINKAYELCKKESNIPQSCKTAKESCEMMMDGVVTMRPMWRCMALDLAANPWFSNVYDHAGDAVLGALAYCKAYSSLPSTCYIDPFVCRDLNAQSF